MFWDDCVLGRRDIHHKDVKCDCRHLFHNVAKGQTVRIHLKGGRTIVADFLDITGKTVNFFGLLDNRPRSIVICCDDIIGVDLL